MTKEQRYGATPEEWLFFSDVLGLTGDLLPVVSNPNAIVSPNSKMKAIGKTPSIYNRKGEVVGLARWTERVSADTDRVKWSKVSDYSISVQTRRVRAIDVDVDDKNMIHAVSKLIHETIGQDLPVRWRADSGNCLFVCWVEGEIPKSVVKVEGGMIEFLGNGQQFVACGTHPKGARYEWTGIDWGIPVLTLERYDAIKAAIAERFGIAPVVDGRLRKRGPDIEMDDPLIEKLDVLSWGKDGQAFIDCPWKDGHSMDSGETQTAYFPKGTGGYQQGHFKCLHAGCQGKSDEEFKDALGIGIASEFEDISNGIQSSPIKSNDTNEDLGIPVNTDPVLPGDWPRLARNKNGILPTINNVVLAIGHPAMCRLHIRKDTFREELVVADHGEGDIAWRPIVEGDPVRLRQALELRGFQPVGRELMRDALIAQGEKHQYDSAIEWLEGLPEWDGEDRVRPFLALYYGAADTSYTRAVGEYIWSALAGRVLVPGVKADMVPVLSGFQGAGKSTSLAALVPDEECFAEISLGDKEDDILRKMCGKMVIEIDELRGLNSRDSEWIKSFIARRVDRWVPKYQERSTHYRRRSLFFGTTNDQDLFSDRTGNRRWLPVKVDRRADLRALEKDRLQLWAQGRELFRVGGVLWGDAESLAVAEHVLFETDDMLLEKVQEWLHEKDEKGSTPNERGSVTTLEVVNGLAILPSGAPLGQSKAIQMEVGKVLRKLGWERKVVGRGLQSKRVWVVGGVQPKGE